MVTRPASNEALIAPNAFEARSPGAQEDLLQRMLPGLNADRQDRERAWAEWQAGYGEFVLMRFVRAHNNTCEADDDIVQDALVTAYLSVERGSFQPRDGVPFIGYVVGIARNKIREARRRERHRAELDDEPEELERYLTAARLTGAVVRQPEHVIERREQGDLLRSGLARLPAARRLVLEHYLAGASTDEIAQRLAMSAALVRQHKCRGLRALQHDLRKMGAVSQAA